MIVLAKKIFNIIIINFLIVLIFISLIELLFGYWFDRDNLGPYMREHRMKNQRILWKDETEKITYFYRRNYYGFRGKDIEPSEIKGIIMGSSVIDERYKPEKYTITELLNKKFKKNNFDIQFINGGVEGQSSAGMVASFEKWLFKLKNFSPKYIIFYLGINDSRVSEKENISNNHAGHLLNPEKKEIFFDNIRSRSIIYDSLRKTKFKYFPRKGFVRYDGKMSKDYIKKYNFTKYEDINQKYDLNLLKKKYQKKVSNYLNRIDKLNEYSKKINSIPIFITNIGSAGYQENLFIINHSLINHCIIKKYVCIDLAKKISPNVDYWYDSEHTTKKGSMVIADLIFNNLEKIFYKKN